MSVFVLENPDPPERRGAPEARFVSVYFGRNDTPGYQNWTDRLRLARKWKTYKGAERYMERYPLLAQVCEIVEVDSE